jgi:PAS domain S-box-containing protein
VLVTPLDGAVIDAAMGVDGGALLEVHYLPIVGLGDGQVIGVEALARWVQDGVHLDTGRVVAVAEKTGGIVEIGRRVIGRACREVVAWNAAHPDRAPLRLSVNVSLHQLTEADAVAALHELLSTTGFDPRLLSLEVSEDSLHELGHAVGPTLLALKHLGIRLSVDDFGTGASSLVALQRYQLDELKIDRSFVAQMDSDGDAAAIVRGVVRLAQSLGLDTVAEGVERPAQEQMLRGLHCDAAQGWLYSRPGPDVTAVVATAEEAAVSSLARKPVDHGELWDGMPTARTAARFVEAMFEASPIGMAVVDGAGRHLAVNPAAARLLGRSPAELHDLTCWEVVHPEDLQADLVGLDRLLRGECPTYVVEERVVGADGRARWVEATVSGVPGDHLANGAPARLLRQIRCTEDSRQANEDAAVLRSVFTTSPDALLLTDQLGRCTLWNGAAEQLLGWSSEDMVGASITRLVGPDDQLRMARVLGDAASGLPVRWPDATWITATGEPVAVDVTVGPITDADGGLVGLVAVARDVTDQRSAEAALRDAHEELSLHATDMAAANRRLEAFAGTLTHDLLQPVVVLDGFLSLLERDSAELSEEHVAWLAGAVRGKERLREAIEALHRHATQDEVPLASVDLADLAQEVLPGLVADLGDAELVRGPLPVVAADRGLVAQVLANLVQNAGRYRHPQRPLVVDVAARFDGTSHVVVVADNGKGISTDELERVFEPGARGRSSSGTHGTGTGLATVRTLMQRMGGEAWAEPGAACGVRMCLRFLPEGHLRPGA